MADSGAAVRGHHDQICTDIGLGHQFQALARRDLPERRCVRRRTQFSGSKGDGGNVQDMEPGAILKRESDSEVKRLERVLEINRTEYSAEDAGRAGCQTV